MKRKIILEEKPRNTQWQKHAQHIMKECGDGSVTALFYAYVTDDLMVASNFALDQGNIACLISEVEIGKLKLLVKVLEDRGKQDEKNNRNDNG